MKMGRPNLMKLKRTAVATILGAAAIALGTAGAAWAREPVFAGDVECGAQGEQKAEANDDVACGNDPDGRSGDQGEKSEGQSGTDERGAMQSGQSGQNGQDTQQDGEFEGDH
jgi:hypothetical protein